MANFFSLALSIHLWYNEVNESGDFMEIKEAEAIKAAEFLKQYCRDVDCSECIFYFRGDCMLSVINDEYDYTPLDWRIDLIKGE